MLKRFIAWMLGIPVSALEHDPTLERHAKLFRLHKKVQRERDAVRSGRERLTTF